MIQELEIPREVPVMTLDSTVLFPQAIMPLYIFEPRYRAMLSEVLAGDRIFAIAAIDPSASPMDSEPPQKVAGVGVVRACRTNEDGTSNLVLQGLARVQLEQITTEEPFRKARIRQILSNPGGPVESLEPIKSTILELLQAQIELGAAIPSEVMQFLGNIEDPEVVLDLSIHTLCGSGDLKQELLETNAVLLRFKHFEDYLRAELRRLQMDQDLKGDLGDDAIGNN